VDYSGWAPVPGRAPTVSLPMPKFTAIGATTRQGLVSAPPARAGSAWCLRPRSVRGGGAEIHRETGRRSCWQWRSKMARRKRLRAAAGEHRVSPIDLLRRGTRLRAGFRADGRITVGVAQTCPESAGRGIVFGLDEIDQKIMMDDSGEVPRAGRWVSIPIAASISEESDTIEEVYEPYLNPTGLPQSHAARDGSPRESALRLFQCEAQAAHRESAPALFLKLVYLSLGSNIGDRAREPAGGPSNS